MRHQIDLIAAAQRCAARGVTVIAILHDLNLAAMLAKRIVVLDRGCIAADGPPSATITDDLLRRVFRVDGAIGRVPPSGTPFVLPYAATPCS
jgi:iron complex transport system ATP-binding protein